MAEAARRWFMREHKVEKPYVTGVAVDKNTELVLWVPQHRRPGADPKVAQSLQSGTGSAF